MNERLRRRLEEDLPGAPVPVRLVHRAGEGPLSGRLLEVAREIAGLASGVAVVESAPAGSDLAPSLAPVTASRDNVRYSTMPDGMEAEPFADLLASLARGDPGPFGKPVGLDRPAELLVFVTPICPHCASTVRAALALSLADPLVTTHVVDGEEFPDLSVRYGVKSVPRVLVDRGLAIHGAVGPEDLARRLRSRGEPEYEVETMRSLVEAGRFDDIVAGIREARGCAAFAAVWRTSTLSLRMGLMVAAETIIEEDPRGLDDLVPALLPALEGEDSPRRGDTADLLGAIAHPAAAGALAAHADDPHPDVAEAVADALSAIAARPRPSS